MTPDLPRTVDFSLYKGRPIGAMTWGAGSIGHASIATLAKDLRKRFMGRDPAHPTWALADDYTMESVAVACREYLYEELYVPAFEAAPTPKPELGFFVAGYSGGADLAEEWRYGVADLVLPPHNPEVVGRQIHVRLPRHRSTRPRSAGSWPPQMTLRPR
jgi:hypothetical protein